MINRSFSCLSLNLNNSRSTYRVCDINNLLRSFMFGPQDIFYGQAQDDTRDHSSVIDSELFLKTSK